MIYCFTANNRTHFFVHVGVLSLFINNGTELSAFASRRSRFELRFVVLSGSVLH